VYPKWLQFRRSRLVRNTLALYGSFLANALAPLITVPYTARVLKPAGYGAAVFALSLAGFAGVVAAYGFGLTASREISINRGNLEIVSRVASEVASVELFLLSLCLPIYWVVLTLVPRLRPEVADVWVAFAVVAFTTLSPTWLYQGMEELHLSARVDVIFKLAYIPALVLFVRKPGDSSAWLTLQAVMAGLECAWLWAYARARLGVRWIFPQWQGIARQLRRGFAIFCSQSAVAMYTSGNVFILGMLTNVTVAGYYGAAERLVKAAMNAWKPLQTAVFPRASQLAVESREAAVRFAEKVLFLQGGMGALLSAGLLAGAPWIIPFAFGREFEPSVAVLEVLSVLPFLIAVSNVLGIQVMVPFNRDRAFALILLAAGMLNLGMGALLAPRWQASGMALSVAFSEFLVTGGMFFYLRRSGLSPFMNPRNPQAETARV
jgi:PST family polysaccharide transporter